MNLIVQLLNLACGQPLPPEDSGRARRLQLVLAALLLSLLFALVWGVAVGVRVPSLMLANAWKVPLVIFLSSAFAIPAGLLAWKLSQAKCRATDLLLGFSGGVFTGTLVLAVLGPVVALYYESSQWAGPVLAQGVVAFSLFAGTIVFARSVFSRLDGNRPTVVLPLAVFKVIQIATLLQLIAIVSPILPERTHTDRGIDGLAHRLEGE
jgi:hypothetical protein